VLGGCRTSVLHSFRVTLCNSGRFLPYIQECGERKHFAAAGVADTGWLFLWSLLDYYIYYVVGCVCSNQAQWSMNCHPLLWGITRGSRNKISAILENLGCLFSLPPCSARVAVNSLAYPKLSEVLKGLLGLQTCLELRDIKKIVTEWLDERTKGCKPGSVLCQMVTLRIICINVALGICTLASEVDTYH